MHEFEVLTAHGLDAARWQSFCDRLPMAVQDVHYTPAYYRVQEAAGGAEARCCVATWSASFIIHPFMLRPIADGWQDVTSPYGFGGQVGSDLDSVKRREYAEAFSRWAEANRVVSEYAALSPMSFDGSISKPAAMVYVDQTDVGILEGAHMSRRHGLARAARDEMSCLESEIPYGFIPIYKEAMERKGAAERWRYNDELFLRYSFELCPDRAIWLQAGTKSGIECAALVLFGGQVAHYHFAARRDGALPGSGELLVMTACQMARRVGARWLNLGGGLTDAPDDPLWRFKSSWTPDRAFTKSYRRIFNPEVYGSLCRERGIDPNAETWFPAYRAKE